MVPSQAIKDAILGQVVTLIDKARAKAWATRSSTYGINDRIIKDQQQDFPWINRNIIDYFRKVTANRPLPINTIIVNNNSDQKSQ